MATRSRIRRNECGTKHAFSSEAEAWGAAARVGRKSLGYVHAYKCRFCGKWHIGHAHANVNRKSRRRKH